MKTSRNTTARRAESPLPQMKILLLNDLASSQPSSFPWKQKAPNKFPSHENLPNIFLLWKRKHQGEYPDNNIQNFSILGPTFIQYKVSFQYILTDISQSPIFHTQICKIEIFSW